MPGRWVKQSWRYDPTLDAPARYRRACHYDAFVPDPISTMEIGLPGQVAGLVADAEAAIRILNAAGGAALAPLARLLLRTESIASSKVEGMQLGVREMARAEVQAELGGRPSPTARELIDNIDAMELALDDAAEVPAVGVGEITRIHERLLAHAPNRHLGGRVRATQNWIGGNDYNPCGADFVPPPPTEVPRLLDDLCAAIADDRLPTIVQAALVHAQFETIHPFEDGNGRTGRALVHVVLRRRGVAPRFVPPVSVVLASAKDRYIAGLDGFRGPDVVPWIEQFASAAHRSATLAMAYLGAVRALQESWRERLRASGSPPRRGASEWAIIDSLPAHPVVTAPVATAATGLAKVAVYRGIERLEGAGVLLPLTGRAKRNRAWEAAGLLPLIERLEAGALPASLS
jgi:Fic family protein